MSEIKIFREALEQIAEVVAVPVRTDSAMYRSWRAIAVERIDIARKVLKACKEKD